MPIKIGIVEEVGDYGREEASYHGAGSGDALPQYNVGHIALSCHWQLFRLLIYHESVFQLADDQRSSCSESFARSYDFLAIKAPVRLVVK